MRPESLFFLFSPVTRIKGIGAETAKALSRLLPPATAISGASLPIVRDVLFHLPVGLVDRRQTWPLREAPDGAVGTFVVTVDEHLPPSKNASAGSLTKSSAQTTAATSRWCFSTRVTTM